MDFGLARFLEMFEERFGRTTTTVLLAALGLAVFGYCIRLIIETTLYFYGEVTTAMNLTDTNVTTLVVRIVSFTIQLVLVWICSAAIFRFYFRLKVQRFTQSKIDEVIAIRDRGMKYIEEMHGKLDKHFELVEAAMEDAKKFSEEADEKKRQLQIALEELEKKSDDESS